MAVLNCENLREYEEQQQPTLNVREDERPKPSTPSRRPGCKKYRVGSPQARRRPNYVPERHHVANK